MRRALLLGDTLPDEAHSIGMLMHVLEHVFDGLFSVETEEHYGALTSERLHTFDLVINYAELWDQKGTKEAAGSLVAYVADGGNYLAVHNGLRSGGMFELDCLTGARFLGWKEPCFLEYCKSEAKHPVTAWFEPFHLTEDPMEIMLDPILAPQVLLEIPYGSLTLPAAWCHRYGWGKVLCMMPGHTMESFSPFLAKFLYRTGLWFLDRI